MVARRQTGNGLCERVGEGGAIRRVAKSNLGIEGERSEALLSLPPKRRPFANRLASREPLRVLVTVADDYREPA